MKCRERLIDEERLIVFKEYWSLGSRDKRADFKLTCDGRICCCHGNGAREKDDAYW
jgi:hypothetical protein